MGQELYKLNDEAKIIFETPMDARYWFGYYNYCPIDESGKRMLAHKWISEDLEREFLQEDTIDVGWFDLDNGEWHYIATTHACNWQQGAMTQWLHIDGKQRIIFNDACNGKYVSRIYNIDGTIYKTLPMAIYGINEKKGFSITMNFERAYWCRAYHYQYIQDKKYDAPITEVDGIYKMDLNQGEIYKIIDIKTIIEYDKQPDFAKARHWVEHIMLNPAGDKFAFYHRFDSGEGFKTRCFIADINGRILCMLKDWKTHSWSHLGWINDETFVIYGTTRTALGNAYSKLTLNSGKFGLWLRKVYRKLFSKYVSDQLHNKLVAGNGYEIYKTDGTKLGIYDKDLLINDGHPSFIENGKYMLTDTYAVGEQLYRYLLLLDTEKNQLKEIGQFYSPINATSYRSDLHPRFGRTNNIVVIDTAHTGRHGMIVIQIPKEWIKSK